MNFSGFITNMPLWLVFLLAILAMCLPFEFGFQIGKTKKENEETLLPADTVVTAIIGLLSLIMAFSFGFVQSRSDERREAILGEANTLSTAYIRMDFLPEPTRTEMRKLLKQYVDVRVEGVKSQDKVVASIIKSEELQDQMWRLISLVAEKNGNSLMLSLAVASINEVFDYHDRRVNAGMRSRMGFSLWAALYILIMTTGFTIGFYSGLSRQRSIIALVFLSTAFAIIMVLIADIDRPQEGAMKANQQALVDLQVKMK